MRHNWRPMCFLLLVLLTGCNKGRQTVGLQGEVSFDGRVIEKGTIDFIPIEGTAGPAAMSVIANGRYEIKAKHGLSAAGTYQVRIIGMRKTGKKERIPQRMLLKDTPPTVEIEENFIPPMYNSQSTLKARVSDLPDKNKVDFHLGKNRAN
jgi:hypothetical protein